VRQEDVLGRSEAQFTAAVTLGQPCQLEELIAAHASHRSLEPDVVQARLALAEDADVVTGRRPSRVAAGAGQRPAEPRLELLAEPLHAHSAMRNARRALLRDSRGPWSR